MKGLLTRYVDPLDLWIEMLYGLLIVLTFTMAFRAIDRTAVMGMAAATQANRLFIAAIGCAVAWGLIDGVVYVLSCIAERAQRRKLIRDVRASPDQRAASNAVADALDAVLEPIAGAASRNALYQDIQHELRDATPQIPVVTKEDFFGAAITVAVAVLATLPVVVALLLFPDPFVSLRVSNLIAIGMLMLVGYGWARQTGTRPPLIIGLVLAAIGVLAVLIAIPLGG